MRMTTGQANEEAVNKRVEQERMQLTFELDELKKEYENYKIEETDKMTAMKEQKEALELDLTLARNDLETQKKQMKELQERSKTEIENL